MRVVAGFLRCHPHRFTVTDGCEPVDGVPGRRGARLSTAVSFHQNVCQQAVLHAGHRGRCGFLGGGAAVDGFVVVGLGGACVCPAGLLGVVHAERVVKFRDERSGCRGHRPELRFFAVLLSETVRSASGGGHAAVAGNQTSIFGVRVFAVAQAVVAKPMQRRSFTGDAFLEFRQTLGGCGSRLGRAFRHTGDQP